MARRLAVRRDDRTCLPSGLRGGLTAFRHRVSAPRRGGWHHARMVRDLVGEALERACAACDAMLDHEPDYDAPPVRDNVGALSDWVERATGRREPDPASPLHRAGLLRRDDPRMELLRAALDVCGEYATDHDARRTARLLEYYRIVRSASAGPA